MKRLLAVAALVGGILVAGGGTAHADGCPDPTSEPKNSVICTLAAQKIGLDGVPVGVGDPPSGTQVVCVLGTGPNTRDGICVWFTIP